MSARRAGETSLSYARDTHAPCGVPIAPGALAGTALSPLASLAGSPLAARETTATSPTGKTGPTVRRHKAYPDVADRRAQMNDQPQVALRRGARRPALPSSTAVPTIVAFVTWPGGGNRLPLTIDQLLRLWGGRSDECMADSELLEQALFRELFRWRASDEQRARVEMCGLVCRVNIVRSVDYVLTPPYQISSILQIETGVQVVDWVRAECHRVKYRTVRS